MPIASYAVSGGSYEKFKRDFARGLQNEEAVYGKVAALKLGPTKSELMIDHYRMLVRDEDVVDRMFEEIKAAGIVDRLINNPKSIKQAGKQAEIFGYALFESLSLKGLRRLDHEDIRIYLNALDMMLSTTPPKLCKALLVGDIEGINETTALTALVLQQMTVGEVEAFLRLVRKAILAEVRDYPGIRTISEDQRKLSEEAFGESFIEKLSEHPRADKLLLAAYDLSSASDVDACQFGQVTAKAILGMKGLVAEWQARAFIEQLQ